MDREEPGGLQSMGWQRVGHGCENNFHFQVCHSFPSKEKVSFNFKAAVTVCSHHQPSLEPKKIKSDTVSTFSPSICHEVMGPDAMILVL